MSPVTTHHVGLCLDGICDTVRLFVLIYYILVINPLISIYVTTRGLKKLQRY